MIRDILKNKQFETSERTPAETSKQITDSYETPSKNIKMLHPIKRPKAFYEDAKSKLEERNSPREKQPEKMENVLEESIKVTELNKLSPINELTCKVTSSISLSPRKGLPHCECKPIKDESIVAVNINIASKAGCKPVECKKEVKSYFFLFKKYYFYKRLSCSLLHNKRWN